MPILQKTHTAVHSGGRKCQTCNLSLNDMSVSLSKLLFILLSNRMVKAAAVALGHN